MAKKIFYWIRQDGNLGRSVGYGDQIPADTPEQRIEELKAQGYVSEIKPADPNAARADALATMHKLNKELTEKNNTLSAKVENLESAVNEYRVENQELKDKLSKSAENGSELDDLRSKVEELEAELDDVPKNVRAANTKIKKLEKELADLTDPKGGK